MSTGFAKYLSRVYGELVSADAAISVGANWQRIIDYLCDTISRYQSDTETKGTFKLHGAHEKDGALHIEYLSTDSAIAGMVMLAETWASTVQNEVEHKNGRFIVDESGDLVLQLPTAVIDSCGLSPGDKLVWFINDSGEIGFKKSASADE